MAHSLRYQFILSSIQQMIMVQYNGEGKTLIRIFQHVFVFFQNLSAKFRKRNMHKIQHRDISSFTNITALPLSISLPKCFVLFCQYLLDFVYENEIERSSYTTKTTRVIYELWNIVQKLSLLFLLSRKLFLSSIVLRPLTWVLVKLFQTIPPSRKQESSKERSIALIHEELVYI